MIFNYILSGIIVVAVLVQLRTSYVIFREQEESIAYYKLKSDNLIKDLTEAIKENHELSNYIGTLREDFLILGSELKTSLDECKH